MGRQEKKSTEIRVVVWDPKFLPWFTKNPVQKRQFCWGKSLFFDGFRGLTKNPVQKTSVLRRKIALFLTDSEDWQRILSNIVGTAQENRSFVPDSEDCPRTPSGRFTMRALGSKNFGSFLVGRAPGVGRTVDGAGWPTFCGRAMSAGFSPPVDKKKLSKTVSFAKENRSFLPDSGIDQESWPKTSVLLWKIALLCRLLRFWPRLLSKHVSFARENRSFLTDSENWPRLPSKDVSFAKENHSFLTDSEDWPRILSKNVRFAKEKRSFLPDSDDWLTKKKPVQKRQFRWGKSLFFTDSEAWQRILSKKRWFLLRKIALFLTDSEDSQSGDRTWRPQPNNSRINQENKIQFNSTYTGDHTKIDITHPKSYTV